MALCSVHTRVAYDLVFSAYQSCLVHTQSMLQTTSLHRIFVNMHFRSQCVLYFLHICIFFLIVEDITLQHVTRIQNPMDKCHARGCNLPTAPAQIR